MNEINTQQLPLSINADRFLQTVAEMAQIGALRADEGGGRDRRPFSAADRAARDYLRRVAEEAGLTVALDGAANLSARYACTLPAAQTILLGSHLDTVPHGGAYDGALGVLAGLEVLRTLYERAIRLPYHVEVVDFTDEEGRFGDLFGSRSLSGQIDQAKATIFLENAAAYPADLATMQALVPGGLSWDGIQTAKRDPATLAGYLELHIEQGPRLEAAGGIIGVVSTIFGRHGGQITFHGRSDHAGTTPLPLRADALLAAAQFIVAAMAEVGEEFPDAVITCGNLTVKPGVSNVVPNQVTLWVEFRAAASEKLARIEAHLARLVERVCAATRTQAQINFTARGTPIPMDGDLQAIVRRAAQACGYPPLDLPSGAGHDAMMLAAITPAAMIFVPSQGGRSHSPDEQTAPEELVAGANVLLQAVLALARG